LAIELKIPIIDGEYLFQKYSELHPSTELFVNPTIDLVHPNKQGHALLAKVLYNTIYTMNKIN
jgi:lysophospholipase L1-like esterase